MRIAALSFVILCSGCLTYTRLATPTPARGSEVLATVSVPLEVRIGEITVHDVTFAQGRVAYVDPDSLVLTGTRFVSQTGTEYATLASPVTIPQSSVVELRQRRVSGWKTGLALGAGAATIAAIIAGVGPLAGSTGGGGPPKPPPQRLDARGRVVRDLLGVA